MRMFLIGQIYNSQCSMGDKPRDFDPTKNWTINNEPNPISIAIYFQKMKYACLYSCQKFNTVIENYGKFLIWKSFENCSSQKFETKVQTKHLLTFLKKYTTSFHCPLDLYNVLKTVSIVDSPIQRISYFF